MSVYEAALKGMALGVLGGDGVARLPAFAYGGVNYHPSLQVPVVAFGLRHDVISFRVNAKLRGARYHANKNELVVAPPREFLTWSAGVVHEAVHAMQDTLKLGTVYLPTLEVPAHVVQMCYLVPHFPNTERLTSDRPDVDEVFRLAWVIAEKLTSGGVVAAGDYQALHTAIASIADYNRDVVFDGL